MNPYQQIQNNSTYIPHSLLFPNQQMQQFPQHQNTPRINQNQTGSHYSNYQPLQPLQPVQQFQPIQPLQTMQQLQQQSHLLQPQQFQQLQPLQSLQPIQQLQPHNFQQQTQNFQGLPMQTQNAYNQIPNSINQQQIMDPNYKIFQLPPLKEINTIVNNHYSNLIIASKFNEQYENNSTSIEKIDKQTFLNLTSLQTQQQQNKEKLTKAQQEQINQLYSAKISKKFIEAQSQLLNLQSQQEETIKQLDKLNRIFEDLNRYDDTKYEKPLIEAIEKVNIEYSCIFHKCQELINLQASSKHQITSNWDETVCNLSECFFELDKECDFLESMIDIMEKSKILDKKL